jgi:hypothetical protein
MNRLARRRGRSIANEYLTKPVDYFAKIGGRFDGLKICPMN